ncbi:MAG: hypothetical protein JWR88_1341 [Pseudonocardia sp.]|nr:hypothetical protein [Pseudonocardia sp.]
MEQDMRLPSLRDAAAGLVSIAQLILLEDRDLPARDGRCGSGEQTRQAGPHDNDPFAAHRFSSIMGRPVQREGWQMAGPPGCSR